MLNKLPFGRVSQECLSDVRNIPDRTGEVPGETDGAGDGPDRYAGFDGI